MTSENVVCFSEEALTALLFEQGRVVLSLLGLDAGVTVGAKSASDVVLRLRNRVPLRHGVIHGHRPVCWHRDHRKVLRVFELEVAQLLNLCIQMLLALDVLVLGLRLVVFQRHVLVNLERLLGVAEAKLLFIKNCRSVAPVLRISVGVLVSYIFLFNLFGSNVRPLRQDIGDCFDSTQSWRVLRRLSLHAEFV